MGLPFPMRSSDVNTVAREDAHVPDEPDMRWCRTVRRRLLAWGRANFQSYPWRHENDPWLALAAEVLLQRTRAKQVEPVYMELRTRYPTTANIVEAGPEAIAALTARVGLHWRGRLLYELALAVNARGGTPPDRLDELRQLRVVGPYTAAAWLSLHRGERAVLIDSNVARWLARMVGNPYVRDPRNVPWIQRLADCLTPRRVFRAYNYAVLDFTMIVCTGRHPACLGCPVRSYCQHEKAHSAKAGGGESGSASA